MTRILEAINSLRSESVNVLTAAFVAQYMLPPIVLLVISDGSFPSSSSSKFEHLNPSKIPTRYQCVKCGVVPLVPRPRRADVQTLW